jgi:hypothetical protein
MAEGRLLRKSLHYKPKGKRDTARPRKRWDKSKNLIIDR